MGDRFKESRGKKLLQLLNTQNKENCDHNLNKEDHEQKIENYSTECLKNPNNDTILEGSKDAEPIAHCSYNVPSQYAQIIRNAKKKGNPFRVNEMSFRDFYSMKGLSETIGFNSKKFKTTEIKVLKLIQGEFKKIFFKYSYKDIDFKEAEVTRKQLVSQNVSLKKAYRGKPKIKENKKRDLLSLVQSNHIPNFYADFYTNL